MSLGDLLLPSFFVRARPDLVLVSEGWQAFAKVPPPERRLLRVDAAGTSTPAVGDLVAPLAHLGTLAGAPVLAPCASRVVDVQPAPFLHGGAPGLTVVLERDPDGPASPASLEPLSEDAPREQLLARLDDLGVCAFGRDAVSLTSLLGAGDDDDGPAAVIVNGADPEPLLSSEGELLLEQGGEIDEALALLGRASGAREVVLTVPGALEAMASKAVSRGRVVALPESYPGTLGELAARRALGGWTGGRVVVISLETALAAARAIEKGMATTERHLTVIGADETTANVTVAIGTPAAAVFDHVGFAVKPDDVVAFGGPMRGRSEHLLDSGVDVTASALMIVPPVRAPEIANDPCVSCGSCVEVCPSRLQPQWLGRNAEFGFFDRNEELAIGECIRCGLCAYVCPSGRPLLQWIELSLVEIDKARAAESEQEG